MKRKSALTLIELMIVIFLIGIIGSVIGYNMMGSMERGKIFKTEHGMQRLHDIVNLQNSMVQIPIINSESPESKYEKVLKLVQDSGLVKGKEAEELMKDGWGNRYKIHVSQDKEISFKSKKYHEVKGIVDPEEQNTP